MEGLIVGHDGEDRGCEGRVELSHDICSFALFLSYIWTIGQLEDFSYVPRVRRTPPLSRVRGKSSELSNRPKGAEFCARHPGQFRTIGRFGPSSAIDLCSPSIATVLRPSQSLADMAVAPPAELVVGYPHIGESHTLVARRAVARLKYSSGAPITQPWAIGPRRGTMAVSICRPFRKARVSMACHLRGMFREISPKIKRFVSRPVANP